MSKISVIVVTKRNGYLKILEDDLRRQTFINFEVIIADDSDLQISIDAPNVTHFVPRQKNEGDVWNINKAYNDCIDRAKGELLVFLQDFIWIPANGLQRFWNLYEYYPNYLVTGVGHKAKEGLDGISEVDERMFAATTLSPGNYSHWELNWASCPRVLMPMFNEDMDRFYGGENHYIAAKSGLPVLIDRDNQCIGYSQEECGGRPEDWEEKHFNKNGGLSVYNL